MNRAVATSHPLSSRDPERPDGGKGKRTVTRLLLPAALLLLAACLEAPRSSGWSPGTAGPPAHLMTHSFRRLGSIMIELKHGSPSEAHWAAANVAALRKCREWGYVEAEVTGHRHEEYSGKSNREYECRGNAAAEAWNRALRQGRAPEDAASLTLLAVKDDDSRVYIDPASARFAPGDRRQFTVDLVTFERVQEKLSVSERLEAARLRARGSVDCRRNEIRVIEVAGYGVAGELLGIESPGGEE